MRNLFFNNILMLIIFSLLLCQGASAGDTVMALDSQTLASPLGDDLEEDLIDSVDSGGVDIEEIKRDLKNKETSGRYRDAGDFLKAVRYFNRHVVRADRMSEEHIVSLFEIFRGDIRNPQYTEDIRNARIETVKNRDFYREEKLEVGSKKHLEEDYPVPFVEEVKIDDLLHEINRADFTSKEELINAASNVFFHVSLHNIFYEKPGFKTLLPIVEVPYQNFRYPFDGHHRLAWFMVNYMFIHNGYTPYHGEIYYAYDRSLRHKLYIELDECREDLRSLVEKLPESIAPMSGTPVSKRTLFRRIRSAVQSIIPGNKRLLTAA